MSHRFVKRSQFLQGIIYENYSFTGRKAGMNALMYAAGRAADTEASKIVGTVLFEVDKVDLKNKSGNTARDIALDKGKLATLRLFDIYAED